MTLATELATELAPALDAAIATVRRNIATFGDSYPDDTTRDGRYPLRPATPSSPRARTGAGPRASGRACSGSPWR